LRSKSSSRVPRGDSSPSTRANTIVGRSWRGFSRGSYSNVPVGASYADYRALARPVGETLLFAGEATSATYPATVHGAYLSGLREARRVAKIRA